MAQAIAPRLRAPRREEEPQPRAHQVPRRQARHRRVPPARARRARARMPRRPAWTARSSTRSRAARRAAAARAGRSSLERRRQQPDGFDASGRATNVYRAAPGGLRRSRRSRCRSATSPRDQMRALADIARTLRGRQRPHDRRAEHRAALGAARATCPSSTTTLKAIGLGAAGAGTIVDVTACPGTDTCKLGIASSRGLAGELRTAPGASKRRRSTRRSAACASRSAAASTPAASTTSPTSASTATAATIGGYTVPHFQVMLGGQWRENAGTYGLAIGAVPSKRIPEVVDA